MIPVRGREIWRLQNCLNSLIAQTVPFVRIAVVEESNSPRLAALCELMGIDYVQVRETRRPFNRSKLVNIGARHLAGVAQYLVAVDMDAIVLPHVLKQVLDTLKAGETRPISVRPRRLSARIKKQESLDRLASRAWDGGDHSTWGMFAVDSFQRFGELRGLDERFEGWGWEDTHYIRRAGGGLMLDLGPVVLHQHHPRATQQEAAQNREMSHGPNANDAKWGLRGIEDAVPTKGPVRGAWYGGS